MAGCNVLCSTPEQRADGQDWRRVTLRVEGGSYRGGARRAVVFLRGSEQAAWAGHYGAKFAAPCLTLTPE